MDAGGNQLPPQTFNENIQRLFHAGGGNTGVTSVGVQVPMAGLARPLDVRADITIDPDNRVTEIKEDDNADYKIETYY